MLSFGLQALGLAAMAQSLPRLQAPVTLAVVANSGESSGGSGPPQPSLRVQCPMDFANSRASTSTKPGPHGLGRVTRHPGFWAFGVTCMGAAVAVPSVPQAAWLAMPTAVALIGGARS